MHELKRKIGKVFTSKFVGTGPSSYKKIIYRAAVSQRLRNTALLFSLFHRAFFNSIMDKTPTHTLFTQHYISLAY